VTAFAEFGLSKPILNALVREGHSTPTPIQAAAIPVLLKGRDLLGIAQTGTGKTAAFALPILNHLAKDRRRVAPRECRVLVLAPTRELAVQVKDRFDAYGAAQGLATGLVIGGVAFGKQRAMLHRGLDILVATPGRLIDVMDKGALKLTGVEVFVLDEVDQMLDLGFIHSIRKIASLLPEHRQNVFFSATMPPAIAKLANALLTNPARVEVAATKPLKIAESVHFIEKPEKAAALIKIVKDEAFTRGLVFTRTKHGADKLVRALNAAGQAAHAIHGNRSQPQREKALEAFRRGKSRILVATDIAARGIDIAEVTHVVNYDLPNVPETYTHRIGRTGRAGAEGVAISFCSGEERPFLRSIEKLKGQRLNGANGEDRGAELISDDRPRHGNRNGGPRKPRRPHAESRPEKRFENRQDNHQGQEHQNGERKFEGRKDGARQNSERKFEGKKFDGRKDRDRKFERDADGAREYTRRDGGEYKGRSRIDDALNAESQKNRGRNFEGRAGEARNPANENRRRKGGPKSSNSQRPSHQAAFHSNDALPYESADGKKGQPHDEGRPDRVRRRRHRGPAGRKLSRHAG
jgi:ATP-dependent RNA helicase RhlE